MNLKWDKSTQLHVFFKQSWLHGCRSRVDEALEAIRLGSDALIINFKYIWFGF